MKEKIQSIFICLFLTGVGHAQNEIMDSLQADLKKANTPLAEAEVYMAISEQLLGSSINESLMAIDKALAIGRSLKEKEIIGESLIWKARVLSEKNDLTAALQCYDEAEEIFSNPVDSFYLAELLNGKGVVYKYQNDFETALKLQYRSAEISEQIGNKGVAANTYNSIANLHTELHNYGRAIEFYEKSIGLLESLGRKRGLAGAYLNMANILYDDPVKKLETYAKAEKIATLHQYDRVLAYIYAGKADFYKNAGANKDSAKVFYRKAIQFAELSGDPYMTAYNQMYLGILELEQNPSQAEAILQKTLDNEYVQGDGFMTAEANYYLSKSFFLQNKYRDSHILLDTALSQYKKIFDEQVANAAVDTDAKYEASKKEAQLARQQLEIAQQKNRQNQIIIASLAFLAFMVGIFQYLFYKQKREKQAVELALQNELAEAGRLRQLDDMKTQFFTNVSHELRTPLTLIISPLEEALKNPKQIREADLKLVYRNSKQLLNLVNEVMDLSKMEAGKLETEMRDINIQALLRRIFFSFQSAAELKGLEWVYKAELPEDLTIKMDVSKLEKILKNLLSNALKFTPREGRVQLTVGSQQSAVEHLVLKVNDNGRGIHPDDLPNIFNRFFQSKNGKMAQGTGIGLALAKQLSNLLGGDLTVQSEWGKGSSFTLNLPIEIVEKPTLPIQDSTPIAALLETQTSLHAPDQDTPFLPLEFNGQRPRILIVEDHQEMSEYLKNALSKNYDCTIVTDGEEALKYLQGCQYDSQSPTANNQLPDLITSDVMMPNMDGFTFREKINERPEWQRIPFVILTARTLEADKLKGFQLGIDDYVTKPFSLSELEARVHNLLKNKQVRQEIQGQDLSPDKNREANPTPENQLIKNAEELVLEKIKDPQFSVEMMAKELGYSPRHLSRTMGGLTGLTPVRFILEIRLQKARQLLESHQFATVSEVQYEVGINSASYFTRKFTERFGKNPKAYLEEVG